MAAAAPPLTRRSGEELSVVLKSTYSREDLFLLFKPNKEEELDLISKGYVTSFFTHCSNFTPYDLDVISLFLDSWISCPHLNTTYPQYLFNFLLLRPKRCEFFPFTLTCFGVHCPSSESCHHTAVACLY